MSPSKIVIGVAGGTGSGKSTVANNLKKALAPGAAVVLDHDSYYKDNRHVLPEDRPLLNYDHPDSLDNDLLVEQIKMLKEGHPIKKPVYCFVSHSRTEKEHRIKPTPIVIVEGILILCDPRLRELMDVKIFVDTDPDIRLIRRIRRDIEKRGRSFSSIREQYYRTVRPMHLQFVEPSKRYADLIIPEGGENKVALDILVGKLFTTSQLD